MNQTCRRLICLLVIFSILLGCKTIVTSATETNAFTQVDPSSPSSTTSTTPSAPDSLPDATGTGYILQEPTWQKPAIPPVMLPKLNATNHFVYDTRIRQFLTISGEPDDAIYPASTTKLFTSYVALQFLAPEDIITVGNELSYVAYDASRAGFQTGDRVSVEALVYGALLPSGCDASYILAAAAGRILLGDESASPKNAIAAFMDECNRLAKELGMENTNLVTPDGYHQKNHKISLGAFVTIAACSLDNATIAKAVSTPNITISYTTRQGTICTIKFENTNLMIHPTAAQYNPLCIGLKTGSTGAAGYCLLSAFEVDGRYILIGVFGCTTKNKRFDDTDKLLQTYLPYL